MRNYKHVLSLAGILVLLASCSAIFREAATQYIWKHWGKINNLRSSVELQVAGFPQRMTIDLYYLKPEQIGVFFQKPASLLGSALIFNRGIFAAYNSLDRSALRVRGIPMFKGKEQHELVKSFLGKGNDYITYQKLEEATLAGRKAQRFKLTIAQPKPHVQWVWLDIEYFFPLKVTFQDPYSGLVSEGVALQIAYNQGLNPDIFKVKVPTGVPLIDFDLSRLEKQDPLYADLPVPFEYLGSVSDSGGSGWVFSDYSAKRPHILYTIHARNPKVPLPLTGFTQKYQWEGETRYSIPIRGYSLIYYRRGDLHILVMSNTTYEELLAIASK